MEELRTAAESGSATAKALLAQITKETGEQASKLQLAAFADSQRLAAERRAYEAAVRAKIQALLQKYDELRVQVEDVVLEAARLDVELPFSVMNREFPAHLRKINLPKAIFGKFDTIETSFTSMESRLMEHKL